MSPFGRGSRRCHGACTRAVAAAEAGLHGCDADLWRWMGVGPEQFWAFGRQRQLGGDDESDRGQLPEAVSRVLGGAGRWHTGGRRGFESRW